MKIAIGADHAGFELKEVIKKELTNDNLIFVDYGTHALDSVDYPDFAHPTASAVESGVCDLGIVVCGSGNGVNMAANKHAGIRCALCWEPEIATLAKQHNNANMIAVPARFVSQTKAIEIVAAFLKSSFEGGRHQKRVEKI
jgi:ribose 5-phosphate isomerase B